LRTAAAISAVVALIIAVVATVLLRRVREPYQVERVEEPAAKPEEVVQVIRTGGGCVACPSEREPALPETGTPAA
jgi:hypothetical protein